MRYPLRPIGPLGLSSTRDPLLERVDRMFHQFFAPTLSEPAGQDWSPRLEVSEQEDAYLVRAELPGVDPEQLEITITRDTLELKGEKPAPAAQEGVRRHLDERGYGKFTRRLVFPAAVGEEVQAEARHGVVTIRVPKTPEHQPRRIPVQGS